MAKGFQQNQTPELNYNQLNPNKKKIDFKVEYEHHAI